MIWQQLYISYFFSIAVFFYILSCRKLVMNLYLPPCAPANIHKVPSATQSNYAASILYTDHTLLINIDICNYLPVKSVIHDPFNHLTINDFKKKHV